MVVVDVIANTDGRRTVFSCPCGHAIAASACAIVRRDSKVTPHDPHRYSYVGISIRARSEGAAVAGDLHPRVVQCRLAAA
jgi:hypothetical protein